MSNLPKGEPTEQEVRELPDMTNVAGFYYTHEKDPYYPQTLIENDWTIHDWLGISAETLYDEYPKKKPRPFDPKVDGRWINQMMEIQNSINRPQLGELYVNETDGKN